MAIITIIHYTLAILPERYSCYSLFFIKETTQETLTSMGVTTHSMNHSFMLSAHVEQK